MRNLRTAFRSVRAKRGASGVDHQTIEMYERDLEGNLKRLSNSLRGGTYFPQAIRRVWIPKSGSKEKRPLGIPTVRDRVVQAALRNTLEPVFEWDFHEHSYGFRSGRGCKDALRRVEMLLKAGHTYVLDADIRSYFDTISHELLLEIIARKVSDGKVIALLNAFLKQDVMESSKRWSPEEGTPQGAVISPLLSNIYLDSLDWKISESGFEMVRYADDLVILCRSEAEARRSLELLKEWTASVGLQLHSEKTRIVDVTQRGGFDFLGYHFECSYRWPCRKSMKKLKDIIRSKTRRCNGHSLKTMILDVNRTLIGWFEYFKHSQPNVFNSLDSWIRMRLRSILRKRRGGRGRGRGRDHQRWPNSFFATHGLFSLAAARVEAISILKPGPNEYS